MEFGILMALLHVGIVSSCTILVILLMRYKKDMSEGGRKRSLPKAA
jgi:hypothetical protein